MSAYPFVGTNTTVEILFSKINLSWNYEENHIFIDNIRAIIIVKSYLKNFCCDEFSSEIKRIVRFNKFIGKIWFCK